MAIAPAPRARRRSLFWTRLHFLVHAVGLSALLVVLAGLILAHAWGILTLGPLLDGLDALLQGRAQQAWALLGQVGSPFAAALLGAGLPRLIALLVVVGLATVLCYLLLELIVVAIFVAGRRSALGFNASAQVALALLLFVCVNVWSFRHPLRYDWTRSQEFTLPADVVARLQRLDPQEGSAAPDGKTDRRTTVIVYQLHKTFGSLSNKPDHYDKAAEDKVVEKVRDLAEELRRLGKQLRVEVLNVDSLDYKDRLASLTEGAPQLKQAIEEAPENSLFFSARGPGGKLYVQRLSFNDFYLLDKKASEEANGGKGNLVLISQGMEPFARRILNLDERPPRVGIAVIHDILSSKGPGDIGLGGLRAALQTHGFEVRDIVLKRWGEGGPPQPAASTRDESRLSELDATQAAYEQLIRALKKARAREELRRETWLKAVASEKLRDQLSRELADQLDGEKITLEFAQRQAFLFSRRIEQVDEAITEQQERLKNVAEQKEKLNVPQLREQQRMTDVRAKLDRLLADVDVLIVPRMTLRNTANRFDNIPASVYRLEDAQVDAIKDYLKKGRPLLACFGPANEPEGARTPPDEKGPDPLERMLEQLGIRFGSQTVLFDEEMEAFAERRAGLEVAGTTVTIPPVRFDWSPGEGRPEGKAVLAVPINPLRESLQVTGSALGQGQALDIRIRHPRPIYFVPRKGATLAWEPELLMTSPKSWNEDKPFPTDNTIPQFQRFDENKADKPAGTPKEDPLETRRRGPFPIGVAVEEALPAGWYDSASAQPATVRVVAIGQGGFFTGKELSPAMEKLMVNTLNWLVGREDYLPHAGPRWSYPRVDLPPDSEQGKLWRWGMLLGLPALFAFLGSLVWLLRRIH